MIYCIEKEGLSPLPSGSLDYLSSGGKSSSATLFNYKDSKVETRTFYGDNGFKKKEITNHDHGFPAKHPYGERGEHAHDYEWDETGKLKNRTTREITPEERKENCDIL